MKKRDRTEEAHDFRGLPPATSITAADIQAKEFGVSRFGGYRMRDVDEFLDELTASVTKLAEENERLRSGAGVPPAPIGAPDLADSARQADEIIERARAEAARIVREAEDGAATGPSLGEGDRAAVNAFLAREREFLQSLAGLVQGHAEAIKAMARTARPTRPAAGTEPTGRADDAPVAAVAATGGGTGGRSSNPADRGETPKAETPKAETPKAETPRADTPKTDTPKTEPIRIDEPEPATVARGEGDDEVEPTQREGDPSLRELFWGED